MAETTEEIEPDQRYNGVEVAKLLGIKADTLYAYRSRGNFPPPGDDKKWLGSELIEWKASRPGQGGVGGRPARTTSKTVIRLSLTDDCAARLRVAAAKKGAYPSDVIEELVRQHLPPVESGAPAES